MGSNPQRRFVQSLPSSDTGASRLRVIAEGHVLLPPPIFCFGFNAACSQQASRRSSPGSRSGNQTSVSQRGRGLLACLLTDPVLSGSRSEISGASSANEPDATQRGIRIGSSSPLIRSARLASLPKEVPGPIVGPSNAAKSRRHARAGRARCGLICSSSARQRLA